MTESQPPPTAYDDLLDRLLAGLETDVEEEIRLHPGLTEDERRALRTLAFAKGGFAGLEVETGGVALPFDRIGEFELVRRLGAGSVGMVFLARQASLPRLVALKLLRPGLTLSREADARLSREAQVLARLHHPNVVTALAYGHDQGVHYLVMEYVEGRGLDEVLHEARNGGARPTAVQVTGWCRDVARALEAAHQAGVVHRDVKPSNIRITPDGRAVLVDFGLALDRPDSTLTTAGAFRGSPRYSSPEQIDPRGVEVDARTDVYSLGVTLYEAITLRAPFEGSTTQAVFARILSNDVEAPTKVAPATPREVETVIMTAIERDRERRYPSAAAFARDLDALLELRDILARPPGPTRRLRKWIRRRPGAAALWAAIVLTLLTAAAMVLFRKLADRRELVRRGAALMTEARDLHARAAAARKQAEEIEDDVERLREEMAGRTLEVEEGRVLARGEGRALAFRFDQETSFHAAVNRAHAALALSPAAAEPHDLLAELYVERWRESMKRESPALSRTYERLVAEHDPGGRYSREIAGLGSASFATEPAGAEVHLFRYEEQAQIVPDGERRIVPVPVNSGPVPVPPGTWCLRPAESGGGLESGDVIFEVAGRRVEGTVFAASAKPPIEIFDVVVSVDGHDVDHFVNLGYRLHESDGPALKTLVFEGKNGRYEVRASSFEELGVLFGSARNCTYQNDFDAMVWSQGAARRMHIPKGLRFHTTATPLFLSPRCSLGRAPLADLPLAPGSYLAHVSHPGFESQRLPFVVEREGRVRLEARLRPAGTTPAGYVYVPPGEARLGRPHAVGSGSIPLATRHVDGFAIMYHEVTVGEFLKFLNAPDAPEESRRRAVEMVWNRTRGHAMWSHFERKPDGRFEAPPKMLDYAASGVTFLQAEAYARWVTSRVAGTQRPLRFSLPTDLEWEKAARGADGRSYTYGDVFHPLWQKSGRSRIRMAPEKMLAFPVDESPYGAYDLAGAQAEWCDRSEATRDPGNERTLRGTAWSMVDERPLFREIVLPTDVAMAESGFRLVVRDEAPASRPESR
jgi:formylglycine-generating enzyme required for sulfatase activity/predicted Ser/Thr protein kinase